MRRRHREATIAGALLLGARFAHGQMSASANVGSARLTQPGLAASGVFTASGEVGVALPHGSLTVEAFGAQASNGNGTGQAAATLSVRAPAFGQSQVELSLLTTTFGATAQLPVASVQLGAKQYFGRPLAGVFYGIAAGTSSWAGASLPVATGATGVWWRRGVDALSVSAAVIVTQSEFRTMTPAGEERTVFDVRYADVGVGWERTHRRATLSASGGARLGIDHVAPHSLWLAGSAAFAVNQHFGFAAGVGRAPADFVRGAPESRYLSLALRLGSHLGSGLRPRPDTTRDPFLSIDGSADRHVVHVRAPLALRVEVMADFTEWQPVPLVGDHGDWTVVQPMSAGLHRVLIRVDGGVWVVPPNLSRGRDDFGSEVGLITVL